MFVTRAFCAGLIISARLLRFYFSVGSDCTFTRVGYPVSSLSPFRRFSLRKIAAWVGLHISVLTEFTGLNSACCHAPAQAYSLGVVHAIVIYSILCYAHSMKTKTKCPIFKKRFTLIHTPDKPPKYCSRACANKAPKRMTDAIRKKIGAAVAGENHPLFKGGWKARGGNKICLRKRNAIRQEYFHNPSTLQTPVLSALVSASLSMSNCQ